MAPSAHPRSRPRGPWFAVLVLVLGPVVLAGLLWVTLAAPFRAHGDAGGGRGSRDAGLRVETARHGDRARLEITGRVPSGTGPVVVRAMGMRDVAAPCGAPRIRSSGAIAVPAGGVRVGWDRVLGRVPGVALRPGSRFAMAGTVALPGPGALRLCVHLLRAGERRAVLRTARPIIPSRAGLTPPSVVLRPVVRDVVAPAARILVVALGVVAILAAALAAHRRWRLVRAARPAADATPSIVPPPWATKLPALPADVLVPDALPWPDDGDLFAGLGPAPDDPFAGPADRSGEHAAPEPRGDGPAGSAEEATAAGSATGLAHPEAPRSPRATPADGTGPGRPVVPATDPAANDPAMRAASAAPAPTAADAHLAPDRGDGPSRSGRRLRRGDPSAGRSSAAPAPLTDESARYPAGHALRDRRAPGRTGPAVDHLLIGPSGVLVARSRGWSGAVRVAEDRLFVRGLDRTRAVDLVTGDVSTVRSALAGAGLGAIPVTGLLLHDRPATAGFDGTLRVRDVVLLDGPGAMLRAVDGGVLNREAVARVAATLDRALPPA